MKNIQFIFFPNQNALYPHHYSESESRLVMSISLWPHTVHRILQARILKWVAFPFSRGFSQPRARTQVSHIAGRFFTNWPIREAQHHYKYSANLKFVIVHSVQKGIFGAKSIYVLHLQLFKLSYNVSLFINFYRAYIFMAECYIISLVIIRCI